MEHDRSYGIQKIFELHFKKDYKIETLFIAAGIFDRFLAIHGIQNLPRKKVCCLSTTSMLLAAKLEQSMSPSYSKMIALLSPAEQGRISKNDIYDMEADILTELGCDFNFPGPVQSMERYLRILGYDQNETIKEMAF